MANIKKCLYCGQPFDIDKEEFVKPNKVRYAHRSCSEEFQEKSSSLVLKEEEVKVPKKEVKCYYCGEKFFLEDGPWRMARINRYAHESCFLKNRTEDDKYIDLIYDVLRRNQVQYVFFKCEKQRIKFVKEGYTNKGIAFSLQYFYEVQKGEKGKANGGIGIVPYVYEQATRYYIAKFQEQERIKKQSLGEGERKEVGQVVVNNLNKKVKKKTFNLDDI